MPEWLKVIVLGFVEGVTEFLPISSTGHLIVVASFIDLAGELDDTFVIFIQIGAVFALLAYYREDLLKHAEGIYRPGVGRALWSRVLVAFVPVAMAGLLFAETLQRLLFSPLVVALSLIAGGVLFIGVECCRPAAAAPVSAIDKLTYRQALLIGVVQMVALIPGMSRSGMSILGGMGVGLDRRTATEFSFYLALPTLGGATVFEFLRVLDGLRVGDVLLLVLGAAVSGGVAWLSIHWLLRYVSNNSFVPFGYYRIVVGVLILVLLGFGVL